MVKNQWYNISNILSRNALFNFVVGPRGAGKTYGAKKFCIDRFIKYGEEFIYLRRFKTEIKKVKQKDHFYNDLIGYDNYKFETKGNEFKINDETAGYFSVLTTAKTEKSVSFDKVKWIIFDEFILDKGNYYYLQDEVTAFLEFYETVARLRDVKVVFISNAITIANPYFIFFNIEKPYQKTIDLYYNSKNGYSRINKEKKSDPDIAVEFYENEIYTGIKKKTRFGQLIAGTDYSDYAIENDMLRDSNAFLQKKTRSICKYTLYINNKYVGVWFDKDEQAYYLSNDYTDNTYKFTFDKQLHDIDFILADKSSFIYKSLYQYFMNGKLYFENAKVKSLYYDIIK